MLKDTQSQQINNNFRNKTEVPSPLILFQGKEAELLSKETLRAQSIPKAPTGNTRESGLIKAFDSHDSQNNGVQTLNLQH